MSRLRQKSQLVEPASYDKETASTHRSYCNVLDWHDFQQDTWIESVHAPGIFGPTRRKVRLHFEVKLGEGARDPLHESCKAICGWICCTKAIHLAGVALALASLLAGGRNCPPL